MNHSITFSYNVIDFRDLHFNHKSSNLINNDFSTTKQESLVLNRDTAFKYSDATNRVPKIHPKQIHVLFLKQKATLLIQRYH